MMKTSRSNNLAAVLDALPGKRVAVVGDLMLDRYVWGKASRISQEAPVPVVRVERDTATAGGAANVARNVVGLGARAAAFGVIGRDPEGKRIHDLLRESGVDVQGVCTAPDRGTTVKTRVIAGNQQVCRIDREQVDPLPAPVREQLLDRLDEALRHDSVDAVILEDYAKGVLTRDFVADLIDRAAAAGVPVALDPHPSHPFDLPGLWLMTPNRSEAFGLAGVYPRPARLPIHRDSALLEVGRRLREHWNPELLLITLGGHGMALFQGNGPPLHIPTQAREVFDVSGAGDTVMASFVLALLAGADPENAARFANCAAGVVVAKVGTAAVSARELRRALQLSPGKGAPE